MPTASGKSIGFSEASMKRTILSGLTFFLVLLLTCDAAIAGGPWKGKIIDVKTKEPLEGAVVLAVWNRVYRTPYGSSSYFYEAKETVTNEKGDFEIYSYTPINLLPLISYMRGPEFTIFKPGYGSVSNLALGGYFTGETKESQDLEIEGKRYRFTRGIIELPRLMTKEERLRNIPGGPTDVSSKKLPLFFRAINEERKRLGLQGEVWR
jgi:hypothetical protein